MDAMIKSKEDDSPKKLKKNEAENVKEKAMKRWMRDIVGLPQYIDLLIGNGMDNLDIIKYITGQNLEGIGIDKVGHRIKIVKEIEILNRRNN